MSEEREQVGSVAEEAAKLLDALQDWAKDAGHESAAAGAASMFRDINEHIATGGDDCRYCPLCQAISLVRQASPEAKQHLSSAAVGLLDAAAAALRPKGSRQPKRNQPVEKISLAEGDDDWPDGTPD